MRSKKKKRVRKAKRRPIKKLGLEYERRYNHYDKDDDFRW